MKYLLLFLISGYQKIISPLLKQLTGVQTSCRYSLSCSAYAKQSLEEYGAVKGLFKAVKRVLTCQPYIDPKNELGNF